jgi:hypothetical protein
VLILPARAKRFQRPQWPYVINWDSPQAQGLFLWVTFPFSGGPLLLPNHVPDGNAVTTVNGAQHRWDPVGGNGADFNTTANNYVQIPSSFVPETLFLSTNGLTIIWNGRVDALGANGAVLTGRTTAYTRDTTFAFNVGATGSIVWDRAHASDFRVQETATTGLVVTGAYAQYAIRVTDHLCQTVPTCFVNGITNTSFATTFGGATGAATVSNQPLQIGQENSDTAAQLDGFCADVRYYNRALSDAEIQAQADPMSTLDLYWSPAVTYFDLFAQGGGVTELSSAESAAATVSESTAVRVAIDVPLRYS